MQRKIAVLVLTGFMVGPLAGCESLPGTKEQQAAAGGGVAGAVIGSAIGDGVIATVLGGVLGAGAGYMIGANSDKLFGNKEDASKAVKSAQSNPATVEDVKKSKTADLNSDGFVTTDELLAMDKAGLNDKQMIARLEATNQFFDLTAAQEENLASQGISRNVLKEMRTINSDERQSVLSRARK
ncbi:MAG: hypothetical protein ACR2FI_10775 [Burkholderiales bacterium]|nr:hypothetical protein [Burkholderiales bacterium]MDQ3196282.1 hypothetical protein [Pseudomonadota bacterium]